MYKNNLNKITKTKTYIDILNEKQSKTDKNYKITTKILKP